MVSVQDFKLYYVAPRKKYLIFEYFLFRLISRKLTQIEYRFPPILSIKLFRQCLHKNSLLYRYFREIRLISIKFQQNKPAKPITSGELFILIHFLGKKAQRRYKQSKGHA